MNTAVLAGAQERAGKSPGGQTQDYRSLKCNELKQDVSTHTAAETPILDPSRAGLKASRNCSGKTEYKPRNSVLTISVVMRLPFFVGLFGLLLALPAISQPTQNDLPFGNLLKDKILTVRSFYSSDKLEFDADGRPLPGAQVGFGPTDAAFHVASIHYAPGKVVFEGDLPLVYYHLDTNSLSYAQGSVRRTVTIDVPDATDQKTIERAIWSVFYRPGEAISPSCTAEEKADFQARMLQAAQPKKSNKHDDSSAPYPPAGICLPLGEHVLHRIGKTEGISAPKQISTPDPSFPSDSPRGRFDGTVNVSAVMDESGHVTTILIIKSLGLTFDQVTVANMRKWTLQPATLNGKPVSVWVTIETRFRRN